MIDKIKYFLLGHFIFKAQISIKKEWFGFFDSDLERLLGNEVFLSYSVYFKNCKNG